MWYPTKKLWEIAIYINWKAFKPSDWWQKWLPIVRIQNLNWNNQYNYFNWNIEDKYLINDWDILISWSASLDVYIWNWWNAVLNQHIFKVLIDENIVNKKFFFYLIKNALSEIIHNTHWVWMKHITKWNFEKIKTIFPPLSTQKLIVQKLDSSFEKIDKSIELTKKNLENIEELNKSVLEEVYWKSEYTEVKIWKIITFNYWKWVDKNDKNENWLYDVYWANGVMYKSDKFLFDWESIIVWRKWSAWALKRVSWKFWASDVTYYVTINKNDNLDYIYNWLKYLNIPSLAQWVKPWINRNHVYELKITLPPLEKQKEIVKHLDQVFEKNKVLKEKYEKKLKDLEEMKQSLLKEAFEGKLVKDM